MATVKEFQARVDEWMADKGLREDYGRPDAIRYELDCCPSHGLAMVTYDCEGDGNPQWVVASMETPNGLEYFRYDGIYSSWGSKVWYEDYCHKVTPTPVVVTEYPPAKEG